MAEQRRPLAARHLDPAAAQPLAGFHHRGLELLVAMGIQLVLQILEFVASVRHGFLQSSFPS